MTFDFGDYPSNCLAGPFALGTFTQDRPAHPRALLAVLLAAPFLAEVDPPSPTSRRRRSKRPLLVGVAIFAVTSLAGGLAPDAWAQIAARVAQGAGAAMMFPQAMTAIQVLFRVGPSVEGRHALLMPDSQALRGRARRPPRL